MRAKFPFIVVPFAVTAVSAAAIEAVAGILTLPVGTPTQGLRPVFTGKPPEIVSYQAGELRKIVDSVVVPPLDLVGKLIGGILSEEKEGNGGHEDDNTKDHARRAVIGPDNRVPWPATEYPYSAMGKIEWSNGIFCSGALVGPRHVATAGHCVPRGPASSPPLAVRFLPSFYDVERFPGAAVQHAVFLSNYSVTEAPVDSCDYKEDWAVLILDRRLGDDRGYLGARTIQRPGLEGSSRPTFMHLGYPGDLGNNGRKAYRQVGIAADPKKFGGCDNYGGLITDADAAGGQSGGPLWIEPGSGPGAPSQRYIYGVCSAGSSEATVFASGNNLVKAIYKARRDYP